VIGYTGGMKRGCLVRSVSWLLVVGASACAAGEPPPVSVAVPEALPSRPATLQLAATFSPLPASVRDMRRFAMKSRALIVTELAAMESLFAATPAESPDRPALLHRLAEGYGELEHVAEADRARDPATSPESAKSGRIASAARMAGVRYDMILARGYPQWCSAPPQGCADALLYYAALGYERAGKLDDARKVYLELLQGWPQSRFIPLAYLAFGELFLEEGQRNPAKLDLAGQSYAEVVKYPPEGNPVHGYGEYRLGQVYVQQGDGAQGLAHLQRAAALAQASGDTVLGALVEKALQGR
jgi:TolA-binding protein